MSTGTDPFPRHDSLRVRLASSAIQGDEGRYTAFVLPLHVAYEHAADPFQVVLQGGAHFRDIARQPLHHGDVCASPDLVDPLRPSFPYCLVQPCAVGNPPRQCVPLLEDAPARRVPLQCRLCSAHAPEGVADLSLGSDVPHVFVACVRLGGSVDLAFPVALDRIVLPAHALPPRHSTVVLRSCLRAPARTPHARPQSPVRR
jgi:hypothetical protein